MSRIGKKIINIPSNTDVSYTQGVLTVKGPKGTLVKNIISDIEVVIADATIVLKPKKQSIESNALWGTFASHISNMIQGVHTPFTKKLILEGIGYKSEVKGSTLALALGFSHPVNVPINSTLTVTAEKNIITISGIDKDEVGQFSAKLRSLKKPEPYKGKGFRYDTEVIKRKQGKKSA